MAEIHYGLRGEIDLASAPRLRSELSSLISQDGANLVIDCTRLDFIDSTGVTVLLEAHQRLHADGRDMSIVNVSGGPRRILEGLGLTDLFRLARDHPAADRDPSSIDAGHS